MGIGGVRKTVKKVVFFCFFLGGVAYIYIYKCEYTYIHTFIYIYIHSYLVLFVLLLVLLLY